MTHESRPASRLASACAASGRVRRKGVRVPQGRRGSGRIIGRRQRIRRRRFVCTLFCFGSHRWMWTTWRRPLALRCLSSSWGDNFVCRSSIAFERYPGGVLHGRGRLVASFLSEPTLQLCRRCQHNGSAQLPTGNSSSPRCAEGRRYAHLTSRHKT